MSCVDKKKIKNSKKKNLRKLCYSNQWIYQYLFLHLVYTNYSNKQHIPTRGLTSYLFLHLVYTNYSDEQYLLRIKHVNVQALQTCHVIRQLVLDAPCVLQMTQEFQQFRQRSSNSVRSFRFRTKTFNLFLQLRYWNSLIR